MRVVRCCECETIYRLYNLLSMDPFPWSTRVPAYSVSRSPPGRLPKRPWVTRLASRALLVACNGGARTLAPWPPGGRRRWRSGDAAGHADGAVQRLEATLGGRAPPSPDPGSWGGVVFLVDCTYFQGFRNSDATVAEGFGCTRLLSSSVGDVGG